MNFLENLPKKFIDKAKSLDVYFSDIEEKFVKGSGKGGQKINKTSSCVFLKHLPSGVEVKCQRFRDQLANRTEAYKLLILKIEKIKMGRDSDILKKIYKLKKQKMKRSKRAKEKILEDKKIQSLKKQSRTNVNLNFDDR